MALVMSALALSGVVAVVAYLVLEYRATEEAAQRLIDEIAASARLHELADTFRAEARPWL
jgi:hypothetical protein